MEDFSYYNLNGRLIRVHHTRPKHFKDITPYSSFPLSEDVLKDSFNKWRKFDTDDWELIQTFNFSLDNDQFMEMYKAFNGVSSYRKPKQKRTTITPELIEQIKRRFKQGETVYAISNLLGISQPTIKKYITV
ncbi:hypothetical protein ACED16_02500 [Enterobacter hormaechei]